MTKYRTVQGDMVDDIVWRTYGRHDLVEAVYHANPGLAARGTILPAGVIIHLPDAPPTPAVQPLRLWGRS